MSASRLWLALVLVLFCLPLFVELGGRDVEGDEAIYSFAVDRMLETGDWLEPKSIPFEDSRFLEKPPLKFWIVAAPIRLGLLPHDQFGLRFWDALFGSLAFVYVFLIGSQLIHPLCGAAAVLVLFAHGPLLFNHGLRNNTMEAPLLLAYSGGVFHFLAWTRSVRKDAIGAAPGLKSVAHAIAVGLYFVLGFMTKFVAVLFLPVVIVVASAVADEYRRSIVRHWRLWTGVSALALALIAPWFVWGHLTYGAALWQSMVGEHVIRRVVSSLDPAHIQPWYFYPSVIYARLREAGTAGLVLAGLLVLTLQTVRRQWSEGYAVVTWAVLPLVLISASTSKVYHYSYPFLPPLAVAAGYLTALAVLLGPAPFARIVRVLDEFMARRLPRLIAAASQPAIRRLLLGVSWVALAVALVGVTYGPLRFSVGATEIRSSGVFRPVIVAFTCAFLAGSVRHASRLWLGLLVFSLLPFPAYRQSLGTLFDDTAPLRTVRDCIVRVQSKLGGTPPPGLYVDVPDAVMSYPLYYYFRKVRPWTRPDPSSAVPPGEPLESIVDGRPTLIWKPPGADDRQLRLSDASTHSPASSLANVVLGSDVLLLLPGPYAACADAGPAKPDQPH